MRDWQAFVEDRLRLARLDPARQARLVSEVAAQLDDVYRDAVLRGAAEEEADRLAREHVGNWAQLSADLARVRRARTLADQFVRDLAHGTRLLGRNKGFTLAALVTLAVCIAANVAVFCVVNAVVLRPLAPNAERLVAVYNSYPKAGFERAGNAVPDYFDRLAGVTAFESQAILANTFLTIGPAGDTERVSAVVATPSLFRVLETRAHRGRLFNEEEGNVGQHRKAILSYSLWQRLFFGDDDAVGRDLRVNGEPYSIVGVFGPEFCFPGEGKEPLLYVPAAFTPADKAETNRHGGSTGYAMMARLKPGATLPQAQQQIDAVNRNFVERSRRSRPSSREPASTPAWSRHRRT